MEFLNRTTVRTSDQKEFFKTPNGVVIPTDGRWIYCASTMYQYKGNGSYETLPKFEWSRKFPDMTYGWLGGITELNLFGGNT